MKSMWSFLRISSYRDRFLASLAGHLRPYLARTPLIWGDRNRLSVGHGVQLVDTLINLRSGSVTIGDDAFFGHGVMLLTGKHSMRKRGAERHAEVPDHGRDIVVGRGAWIASGAIVLGPCTIGDDAVIGAGSVVTGVVPPFTVFSGNPARLVRDLAWGGEVGNSNAVELHRLR